MDNQETRYMNLLQKELEEEKIRRMQIQNEYGQSSGFSNSHINEGIAEIQLDLEKELDRIHHLLSGHVLVKKDNEQGGYTEGWDEPKDDRLKILSPYGVDRIMNLLSFYLTPNTLLSNYKEEMIMWKIRDFGIELADLMFTQYELIFSYPSPEELFEKYLPYVTSNYKNYPNLLIVNENGQKHIDETALYNKCVQWSREEMQLKFRNYPTLLLAIVDVVHNTYLRALNGEERESLRKQIQIHQSSLVNQPGQQKPQGVLGGLFTRT